MNRKSPDDGEPMKREPKDMSPVRRMTDEKLANRSADKLGDKLAGAKAKAIVTAVCILLALVSAFPLANHFSSPDTYAGLIASLDEKAGNVAALTATSTAASVVVTMIPGDVGTPVAEKLVDISADFGIVLAAIYLEKYLLTIFGMAAFRILLPAGLITLAAVFWTGVESRWHHIWGQLAFKFLVFALATAVVVPAGVWVSDLVEQTYQGNAEAAASIDESADGDVTEILESAKTALNRLVESLVVMIVTNCVIPILVLVFFAWLCKMVLGVDLDLGARIGAVKTGAHRAQGSLGRMRSE